MIQLVDPLATELVFLLVDVKVRHLGSWKVNTEVGLMGVNLAAL